MMKKSRPSGPALPNRGRRRVASSMASSMASLWAGSLGGSLGGLLAGSLLPAQASEPLPAMLPFEPDTLQKIVLGQRGQPFWLVLWDLNCPYCMVTLRLLGERQRIDPTLRVFTVATDSIDEADALEARLKELGVRGPAWAFGEAAPEALRHAIDPLWRGEKPRSYYYDADGKRQLFVGVLRSEQLSSPRR